MKANLIKGVFAINQPKQRWLRRFSVRVQTLTTRRPRAGGRLKLPLIGEAGALAALNRLYTNNATGMKRLADS
jgi:hypothetical protein